jgi:hypothetical protein
VSALNKYRQNSPGLTVIKPKNSVMVGDTPFTAQQVKAIERATGVNVVERAKSMDRPKGLGPAYARQYKDNPNSTTPVGQALQGPFQGNTGQWGLFSQPGVRPERFSAMPRPLSMLRLLIEQGSLRRSEFFNEILEIMTGATDGTGTNATGFCATPPTAGQLQTMARIFKFGAWYLKSQLNAVPNIGQLVNRADVPGRILNAGPEANPLIPDVMYQLSDTRSQLQYELFTVGISLERTLEQVAVVGNSALASTNTHVGWINEFAGLDSQIKTGYSDAFSGISSNAVDSISENWGNQTVGNTQVSSGRNIVQLIADIYYGLIQRAAQVGMEGFEMAIVMRPEFFRALTDVYACSYATARCTNGSAGAPQIVDQTVVNNLRIEMLDGQYLLIEGVKVPVVFTQGIPLTQLGSNLYSNTFYFVPVSWAGRPLISIEYFPMDNQYATEYRSFVDAQRFRVLNNGLYLVGEAQTPLCLEFHFSARMRLILESPFLAARIDNVQFTYLANSYSPYPAETYLYRDGGVSYRPPYYSGY